MSESVFAGLTSQTIDVFLADSSSTTGAGLAGLVYNTASLAAYYRKGATGSATSISLATQTVGGAWTSGGFVEVDATNMKGVYRFDLVNAMVDTEGFVTLYFSGAANLAPTALRIDCRPLPADVKKWLGTAPATPTVAGVPEVDVTHLLGTAWLTPGTAGTPDVNVKLISDDSTAADNAEAFFDGTGYAGTNNVIPTVTTVTNLTNAPTSGDFTATMKSSITTAVPTVGAIADQVWEEAIVDHSGTSGSTAEALNAAGSAGDPWTTSLPGSYTGTQAGKILADVLVDTGTTLQGELDGIQADTEDIQSRLPAALVSGRMDSSTGAMAANVITAAATAADYVTELQSGLSTHSAADVATAINSAYGSGKGTSGTIWRSIYLGVEPIFTTTVTDVTSDFVFNIDDGDGSYNVSGFGDHLLRLTKASTGIVAVTPMSSAVANGTGDIIVGVFEALAFTPTIGDKVEVIPAHVHDVDEIASQVRITMDAGSTQLAAIVADTNELQTDWANGGRLDLILDARASQSSVDDLPTNAELAAAIITGLTTALTEGYRATGATGSVRDILYEILGHMANKGIAGTTLTTKKLDKTTTAKTYTLDADPATSIEETT